MAGRGGVPGSNTLGPIWVTSAFAAATLITLIMMSLIEMVIVNGDDIEDEIIINTSMKRIKRYGGQLAMLRKIIT